jgi:hypothetical protein
MTHTLHRFGTAENLSEDYVVFAMSAKGINEKGSAPQMKRFLELAFSMNPINAGDMKTGNIFSHTKEQLLAGVQDVSIVHAVFTSEEKVAEFLECIKAEDLGLSVVVSGLIDRVKEIGKASGIPHQHTVECSGGVWGRTDKLPSGDTMQVTTMCGHGMVAAQLVERRAKDINSKRMTPAEAAKDLAGLCVCGVFNPVRAEKLLLAIAARLKAKTEKVPVQPGQTALETA